MSPSSDRDSPREGDEETKGQDPEPEPFLASSSEAKRKRKHRKNKKKRNRSTQSNSSGSTKSSDVVLPTTPVTHPRPPKISAKLVAIRNFDGTTPPGFIDAGAGDWLALLNDQMDLAQLMTGETWTDGIKLSILVRHLRGEAEDWYRDHSMELKSSQYDRVCSSFLEAHRCPLNSQQILDHVSKARKRPDETYKGYARRLRSMAANINDGKASQATDRQAFITFFKYTRAKLNNDLITKYRRLDAVENPWKETLDLCEMLAEHFGGDGRIPIGNSTRNDTPTPGRRPRDDTNDKDENQRGRKQAKTTWTNPGNKDRNQQSGQQRPTNRSNNSKSQGNARRVEVVDNSEKDAHPNGSNHDSKDDESA